MLKMRADLFHSWRRRRAGRAGAGRMVCRRPARGASRGASSIGISRGCPGPPSPTSRRGREARRAGAPRRR